jgi:hypothetical protein
MEARGQNSRRQAVSGDRPLQKDNPSEGGTIHELGYCNSA